MEWEAAGIVLVAAPYGEGDALAAVFSEDHGVYRGLARGGMSRSRAATWQVGNLVEARWVARLAEQLGSYTAELVHPSAALAMQDAWSLGVLTAACAVAEGALPERAPQPEVFRGLLHLIVHLSDGVGGVAALVEWELGVLRELGFGLDLSRCALSGTADRLAYVSPKTGRAVSEDAAGAWAGRLLRLPGFLLGGGRASTQDLADGLRLTGHFLSRDVFGLRHKGLPLARVALQDRVEKNP
jgi:DNA repair protein RecO (recombination protein O)